MGRQIIVLASTYQGEFSFKKVPLTGSFFPPTPFIAGTVSAVVHSVGSIGIRLTPCAVCCIRGAPHLAMSEIARLLNALQNGEQSVAEQLLGWSLIYTFYPLNSHV